ncbi:Uncharacterised protein [Chlamydia abortus]|nr:Uncharacterised protein [Chlamydia abortus]
MTEIGRPVAPDVSGAIRSASLGGSRAKMTFLM